MEIKKGMTVLVDHYSKSHISTGIIMGSGKGIISLKPARDMSISDFFEGDPAVLLYRKDESVLACECAVVDISMKDSVMKLKVIETWTLDNDVQDNIFPVSLCADILNADSRARNAAYIRSLGIIDIVACSGTDFCVGDEVEMDLYPDNKLMSLKAEIIWKVKETNIFDYGLRTVYVELNARNRIKMYLQHKKEEYKYQVEKLNETNG